MLLGGAVAGQGAIDIYLLIAIAWFAAWLGDTTSFFIGRRLGRDFVLAARAALRDQPRALRTESRTTSPATAARRSSSAASSASSAPSRRSSPAARACATAPSSPTASSAPGSGSAPTSWSATSSRAASTPPPSTPAKAPFLLGTLIVVVVGVVVAASATSGSRRTGARRCAGWRTTPRPAGSSSSAGASGPSSRFLWDRVTPGGTFGLEFTTLMAALAVSLFVLIAYTVVVGREPGPDAGRHDRDRSRRTPPRRLADRLSPRWSPPSAPAAFVWPLTRGLRAASWPRAGAGPRSASCSPGWR